MLATYLLTLSGSLIIYEGEEIGMINAPKDWDIDAEYKDVCTVSVRLAQVNHVSVRSTDLRRFSPFRAAIRGAR